MDLDHPTCTAMLEAMPHLRRYAISLCRDEDRANDLTQQALLRACMNIEKFAAGSCMVAWLLTILRNQHYSDHRRQQREVEDVDGTYAQMLVAHPQQIAHLEHAELVAALTELPHDMRRAIILVGIEGFSYEQAAELCNCSLGTVKSRVHRARTRLAETLSFDLSAELHRTPRRGASAPPLPAISGAAAGAWDVAPQAVIARSSARSR